MSFDPEADSSFTMRSSAKNYGRFYRKWVRNNFKSTAEGKEVGEYKDYVLIISPGQKGEFHRVATPADKAEFPAEWKAYSEGKEQIATGTPVEVLPGLDSGRAASLKALYILTIEQLAALSDAGLQQVGMGGIELRDRAKKYLETSSNLRGQLDILRQENTDLKARLEALESRSQSGPARPILRKPEPRTPDRPN